MAKTGRPTGERTKKFIENYMHELQENGLTCKQISKKYGISYTTALDQLQKIADANGVARDSLLERPNKPHKAPLFTHTRNGGEIVNVAEINAKLNKLLSATQEARDTYENLLLEE